jgi:hypothetical protein
MREDTNISVIIIYSFVFLFIVFFFLQQENIIAQKAPTGSAIFDVLEEFSLITLIIVIVVVGLIVGGYFIYKKIKNKKQVPLEIPKPPSSSEKSLSNLNKEFNIPSPETKAEKQEQTNFETDLNQLFNENIQEVAKPKEEPKIIEKPKEIKFDLEKLKNIINALMKKNYSKESIVKYLNSKGFTLMQIKQAINSINEDVLSNYIKNSLSQGFKKQEIIKKLLESNWTKEDISKYFS